MNQDEKNFRIGSSILFSMLLFLTIELIIILMIKVLFLGTMEPFCLMFGTSCVDKVDGSLFGIMDPINAFIIVFVIFAVFHRVMMYRLKKYNYNIENGFKINAFKYKILCSLFGWIGIHRFSCGDKEGGKKYLLIIVVGIGLSLLLLTLNIPLLFMISLSVSLGVNISNAFVDESITKFKTKDSEGNIIV